MRKERTFTARSPAYTLAQGMEWSYGVADFTLRGTFSSEIQSGQQKRHLDRGCRFFPGRLHNRDLGQVMFLRESGEPW